MAAIATLRVANKNVIPTSRRSCTIAKESLISAVEEPKSGSSRIMSGRCVYNDGVFLAVQCSSNNQCNWNQYCALTGYVDYLNGMMIPYGICVPR